MHYRPSMAEVKCASCGSDRVGPLTELRSYDRALQINYYKRSVKKGFFSDDTISSDVVRARACLACGHVMPFVGAADLEKLRAHEGDLETKT